MGVVLGAVFVQRLRPKSKTLRALIHQENCTFSDRRKASKIVRRWWVDWRARLLSTLTANGHDICRNFIALERKPLYLKRSPVTK
jgi:hypothetical protein